MLCKHKEFVVINAFCRIARQDKSYIESLDLVTFFRDQGLVVSEGDCYMLVKMFDSGDSGHLDLGAITTILCPRSYTYKRHLKGTKRYYTYGGAPAKLTHDIEFAVMQVLQG